jgi:hypothetical protein
MGVRQQVAVALSAVLALFIRLYQLLTSIIFAALAVLHPHCATNNRIMRSWGNLAEEDGTAVREYIHVVANSSLSLMLAFGVLHYH